MLMLVSFDHKIYEALKLILNISQQLSIFPGYHPQHREQYNIVISLWNIIV